MHLQCRCLHWNVLNAAHSCILALEFSQRWITTHKSKWSGGDNEALEADATLVLTSTKRGSTPPVKHSLGIPAETVYVGEGIVSCTPEASHIHLFPNKSKQWCFMPLIAWIQNNKSNCNDLKNQVWLGFQVCYSIYSMSSCGSIESSFAQMQCFHEGCNQLFLFLSIWKCKSCRAQPHVLCWTASY